jgi:hypothetical protein
MYLVETVTTPDSQRLARIYMRDDGLFEGRVYGQSCEAETVNHNNPEQDDESFEVCALTETLPRARTIVYEELGL